MRGSPVFLSVLRPLHMGNSLIFVTLEYIAVYENSGMIFLTIVTPLLIGVVWSPTGGGWTLIFSAKLGLGLTKCGGRREEVVTVPK